MGLVYHPDFCLPVGCRFCIFLCPEYGRFHDFYRIIGEKAGLKPAAKNEFSGNFSYVDNFDADNNKVGLKELNPRWMFLRDFVDCYKVENGKLKFNLLPGNIYKREPMSAIWARQQHGTFTAETEINFTPRNDKDIAGLALLQKTPLI